MSEKEPLTFREAPEVEAIACDLIRLHHTHLRFKEIKYLFRSEPEKVSGKTALGTARKVTGLNAYLAGSTGLLEQLGLESAGDETTAEPFFVMQIWEFGWTRLTDKQRVALVDHELCHFFVEDGKLTIMPHDLEEFVAVVHRHGLWYPDVEAFVKVAARKAREDQQELFDANEIALKGAVTKAVATVSLLNLVDDPEVVQALLALGYRREEAIEASRIAAGEGDQQARIRRSLAWLTEQSSSAETLRDEEDASDFERAARWVAGRSDFSISELKEAVGLEHQEAIVVLGLLKERGVIDDMGNPRPKVLLDAAAVAAMLEARNA